jgi:hypothetical protein
MAQPNTKVEVVLDDDTRRQLEALARAGGAPARRVRQARILLMADEDRRAGRHPDWYIAECVGISERQVCRIRKRFAAEGLGPTPGRRARSDAGIPRVVDGAVEARLVALCCSTPPAGRQRWTLRLLADELGRLKVVASVCPETVRRTLKKTGSSPGGPSGSASRRPTGSASSRTWSGSSTSTTSGTTRPAR